MTTYGLGGSLDVVTKDLAVTLGAADDARKGLQLSFRDPFRPFHDQTLLFIEIRNC